MKLFLITTVFLCSQITQAQVAPYDKLKNLFNAASAPKSIASAEAAVSAMTNCAESNSFAPGELNINNKLKVLSYSTPDRGPEFPSITTNYIVGLAGTVDSPSAVNVSSTYRPILTAHELQLETKIYSSKTKCSSDPDIDDCWDVISTTDVKLNIKMSPKYVLYQLDNYAYGYCWK